MCPVLKYKNTYRCRKPPMQSQTDTLLLLREPVLKIFAIKRTTTEQDTLMLEDLATIERTNGRYVATFEGHLHSTLPSDEAYDFLESALAPMGYYALFRQDETGENQFVHIVAGNIETPRPLNPLLPLGLFVATVLSVMFTGTMIAIGEVGMVNPAEANAIAENVLPNLWRGLPYALAIMLILGVHEMGHYLMMRHYKTASSLPYFIPAFGISPFGTFGAAILLRQPLRNRKVLFDVGAAGPLAGFLVAIPILLYGLATSSVIETYGGLVEGNSVFYALAKFLVFGQFLPNGEIDVLVNQWAWAGWTGLFVTALNLIPLGQLDGGHVIYALFGNWARRLYFPLIGIMIFLTLFVSSVWLLFGILLALLGRLYAVPLDDITPLDERRQQLAMLTLVLFGLLFVPVPLAEVGVNDGLLAGLMGVGSWVLLRRLF